MTQQRPQPVTPSAQPKRRKSGEAQPATRHQPTAGISNRPPPEEHLRQEKLPPPGKTKKEK